VLAKERIPLMVIEEGAVRGGLGSAILEFYCLQGIQPVSISIAGVPDIFVEHATIKEQRADSCLTAEAVAQQLASLAVRKRQRAT
jgi:1-deoxy-D-xylulose-5-phosphate synthase